MTRRTRRPTFSSWQKLLLGELEKLAADRPQEIQILEGPTGGGRDDLVVRIGLDTSGIPNSSEGLELGDAEEFVVRTPPSPFALPHVEVDHRRFLGYPHVLQGRRLCIYLDPSREWQPAAGMAGFLNRLWSWLNDAAGGVFDPATAMYHAVGGVLHQTTGVPTLVVREEGPNKLMQSAYVLKRTPQRYDLTYRDDHGGRRAPVISLSFALPLGAGQNLGHLLKILDDPYGNAGRDRNPRILSQSVGFLRRLLASAVRNPDGYPQYFVLAVPHPAGGPHHLLGGRLTAEAADALRATAKEDGVVNFDPEKIDQDADIEWCAISDERQQVTIRRDEARPVNGFLGKTVHVWGCGGLGSWMAEFIARAGASEITVCDPGSVSGGLLVRQNYREDDIGTTKAEALARRLEAIRDDLTVVVETNPIPENNESVLSADLVVDATVSNSIAAVMDVMATRSERRGLIAQVATDARSGTLGVANICAAGSRLTPSAIDRRTGESVLARADLEAYHTLWDTDPDSEDSLIPTRGCSVPTFHGSAADLAGVSAAFVNVIGTHLMNLEGAAVSGTHLVALPYAGSEPAHVFIPIDPDEDTAGEASG
jgi:molybdopterin/thiamine biosynthesis adenylyltransferase